MLQTDISRSGVSPAAKSAGTGEPSSRVVVAREDDLDFLGREYRDLFPRSDATAFQAPSWLHSFYAVLAPYRGAGKVVLTLRSPGDRRLIGVLPLILRRKSGVALLETTDLGVGDYAALVIDRDRQTSLFTDPHAAEAVRAALPPHDILRIRPIRAEHVGSWCSLLNGTAEPLGFSAHATQIPSGYAAWRKANLRSSLAKRLDRMKRQFAEGADMRFRALTDATDIATAVAAIQALRAGRFDGDPIQQDAVRDFYAAAAEAGAKDGSVRLYGLFRDGEAAGYLYGLTHAGRYNYILIGADYDRFGRFAPGLLMYDMAIEDWDANGGQCFDFTIGDEPFKADFGTEPTAMHMLTNAASWRGRLALTASAGLERLRAMRPDRKQD
jgi:CelD/BcsL family acetyltransferase involved in cellulose biosynthesis